MIAGTVSSNSSTSTMTIVATVTCSLSHSSQNNSSPSSTVFDSQSISLTQHVIASFDSFKGFLTSPPSTSPTSTTQTNSVDNSISFVVRSQLKSLYLTKNPWLRDESIQMLASIFPNLEFLDLSYCDNISEDSSICYVLRRCSNIRHLKLTGCSKVKLHEMNFEVPKLEVLNLSKTRVDDEALHLISKSCRWLLQLLLEYCSNVTEIGVKHVVENCTQLREINLRRCHNVRDGVLASFIFSRPSLRKITPPYYFCNRDMELLSRHGCIVCYNSDF